MPQPARVIASRLAESRGHNPVLDGIRGLAILGVLLTHAVVLFPPTRLALALRYPMTFGWAGVDLFFVLSGFLITGILLDTRSAANRARSFYIRRFLRIFPLYYLALLIAVVYAALLPRLESLQVLHSWSNRVSFFLFLQNWLALRPGNPLLDSAVGHFWSLAVEEQFYLLWPWFVWSLPARWLLRLSVLGIGGAFTLRLILVAHFGPHLWINLLTITRGEGLLAGSLIALLAYRGVRPSKSILFSMASLGAGILAFIAWRDPYEFLNTDAGPYMYTVGLSGITLLCGALTGSSFYQIPVLTGLLTRTSLRALGIYSYGMYVYHVPLYYGVGSVLKHFGLRYPLPLGYSILVTAVLVTLTFLLARLSYQAYEARFLRMKRHFEPVYPVVAVNQGALGSFSASA